MERAEARAPSPLTLSCTGLCVPATFHGEIGRIHGKDKPFRDGMASRCRRRAPSVHLKRYWAYVQHGDVADGAVVVGGGAGARDARVEAVVAVEPGAVDGGAAAGLAADVPLPRRRPLRALAPSPQDRVQRRRCTRANPRY